MSFEFLAPDTAVSDERFAPIARSPMERAARAAGARFEARDGWNVAVGYASLEQEREACRRAAGWADVSHLGKLELHASAADDLSAVVAQVAGGAALELGSATRAADAWWLPMSAERAVVVCEAGAVAGLRERLEEAAGAASRTVTIVDATSKYGAMTIAGPLAREVFARFTAIDLRPPGTPVGALRPLSDPRPPGPLLRGGGGRFPFPFGAPPGAPLWGAGPR